MRLLSLIESNIFSGPHNHDARLNRALARAGVETIVLLPDEPGDASARLRAQGVKVITYSSSRPRLSSSRTTRHLRYLASLARNVRIVGGAIKEHRIDLVQLSDPFHPHGALAARMGKRPLVVHLIGMGGSPAARLMASQLTCRLGNVLLTNGVRTRAAYPGLSRLGRQMFSYFSPIDLKEFQPDLHKRLAARRALRLADDDIAIGYIARLHPEKDHYTCIRALADLQRRFGNVRFIMMGGLHPGCDAYLTDLQKIASSLGLVFGKDVIHVDAGPNVATLAQVFDIGWSAGFQEGATSSVGEAMALGVPVVGAGNSAVREMIEEGVSGFLFTERRPDDLARITIRLIENEILRNRMRRAARERAVKLFGTERCATTHLEAYKIALSGSESGRPVSRLSAQSIRSHGPFTGEP